MPQRQVAFDVALVFPVERSAGRVPLPVLARVEATECEDQRPGEKQGSELHL